MLLSLQIALGGLGHVGFLNFSWYVVVVIIVLFFHDMIRFHFPTAVKLMVVVWLKV